MGKRVLIALAMFFAWSGSTHAQDKNAPVVFPQLGHNGFVMSVTFSPDNTKLASGSWDGTVKIWTR